MHVEISKFNPLFKKFEVIRKQEGFTTFKSAIIDSMKLFVKEYSVTSTSTAISNKPILSTFYFNFKHCSGYINNYFIVKAVDILDAKIIMSKKFGNMWNTYFTSIDSIKLLNLTELKDEF